MIIGLTGSMGCGKGEAVEFLKKKGFSHITLSSMVREEARKRGVSEERESLMEVGNSLRANFGTGVLAKMSVEKIKESTSQFWVIDGIRNPAEIIELKKEKNAYVIGIQTDDLETLVFRIIKRRRPGDALDLNEIIRKIERELGQGEPENGQRVGDCLKMVDFMIANNGTLEEFLDSFEKLLEKSLLKN